ncbi:phenylalanine--tRNA ligase subunit beta [Candidatus Daviesbacteria bacterium RIFCSPLOWO2_01_FULL_43_38]|uniref:phenylalanine--tRNA ligase n=3 Tax=Candidatus Daviesiibacteriota TaxID=1752718 RepID=A0A1F5K4T3_9BACT|nr:MAG: Phenylalanine-tRNA ligase beta subunit [Candidatus Daviesbacteria bacterium GW2011_GWA1_42_6]KKS71075.1 MAG: Phenylalanine-tRNA ligase beta subunit [Candidatus Daviesbacteria bacterium GW2011_GWA2_42_7]OGE19971.1 MAG: phenylalanine--tRNA ligase subunit beta [Candidatus Daviesbacteria bacterium RIFCSPHIGHO2_01_FULL_43_17]OGE35721.1 MAG: phenylalanine--tRNA ligase subunit beta [Candidatus Daviesbacteria bacterium RIFCSPHIGHO2_12_FULL_43_11]OGE63409.1 MAG: phenylalanine--tRNA ligase subuni
MKVSITWLKELVDLKVPVEEVVRLLPLHTIGTKEVTEDFIELDMKGYNRADLLSMRGVAYEIAAITDSEVTFTEPYSSTFAWTGKDLPEAQVKVENTQLAPLYCIAKISGLKVGPSSPEWVKKLEDCGIRSINNVADVTNLVMLEYGQPSHAFDAAVVQDESIIVRTAKEGETLLTLDNKIRQLSSADLLITDSLKPLGLAGVMGGKDSEVTDSTTSILLEVAIFDPGTIRKTAQRHNLPSEASKRFQHGLTKVRALQALDALIRMYQGLGGKLEAISITDNLEEETKNVPLTQQKVNSLIGIEIKPEDTISYLEKLRFHASARPGLAAQGLALQAWEVTIPYWRMDIGIEEDLIEEVARMYGYEKIPAKELGGALPEKIDQSLFDLIYSLKTRLAELGLTEVQTYSFYSTKVIENLKLEIENLIRVANPISSETEYLRTHLWPNLVETVAKNIRQGFEDIAIFEIGKTYQTTKSGEIQEEYKLAIALLNDTDNPTQELYQIFQSLGSHLRGLNLATSHLNLGGESKRQELFHPTRHAVLEKDGQQIGKIAEVHPRITDKLGIDKRVAILEILLTSLLLPR